MNRQANVEEFHHVDKRKRVKSVVDADSFGSWECHCGTKKEGKPNRWTFGLDSEHSPFTVSFSRRILWIIEFGWSAIVKQEKLSPGLAFRLKNVDAADLVDVIVELETPALAPSSTTSRSAAEAEFTENSAPVTGSIEQMGGKVLGAAWINGTVRAQVPARSVRKLASLRNVERIDVPRGLKLDTVKASS